MGRKAYQIDKDAIMIDYALRDLRFVYERYGKQFKNPVAFAQKINRMGITKRSSREYLETLKRDAAKRLEREVKPTILQRVQKFFGGAYAA